MKPDAISRYTEVTWVALARIWPMSEHLLKAQDVAIVVFGLGAILYG
jgi:hypothetical protein